MSGNLSAPATVAPLSFPPNVDQYVHLRPVWERIRAVLDNPSALPAHFTENAAVELWSLIGPHLARNFAQLSFCYITHFLIL